MVMLARVLKGAVPIDNADVAMWEAITVGKVNIVDRFGRNAIQTMKEDGVLGGSRAGQSAAAENEERKPSCLGSEHLEDCMKVH
jgi:hypothetical protein